MRPTWGFVALWLCACGDPRAVFVGHYAGANTRTYANGDVSSETDIDVTLTAPQRSDRLIFDGVCEMSATVADADTIQTDPVACPSRRGTSIGGVMATYQTTFKTGVGDLTGKTLSLSIQGEQLGTNYADGSPDARFPFIDRLTLTKQ